MTKTQREWDKLEIKLTSIMENKVESIIGEDGLTVWDFAELRDSIIDLIQSELSAIRTETIKEVVGMIEEMEISPKMTERYWWTRGDDITRSDVFKETLDHLKEQLEGKK